MKPHKKILTHYLSSTSPVDKEGYLYKKKKRNATYLRRWFVLKGNLLFYQERPADRHLLGVIVLEGCTVCHSEPDGPFAFSLVFEGAGLKTYRLAAGDRESQGSWMKALLSASHSYLALLLRDLRSQYEEAKRQHRSGESCHDSSAGALMAATSIFPVQGAAAAAAAVTVREGRSVSASIVLQQPTKATAKHSPVWLKKNALVTPLNAPATLHTEWPLTDFNPLVDFQKLHDYYGQEVKKAREEWLKSGQATEEQSEGALASACRGSPTV